ncbi:MAG: ATP-binding protein [Candidatus Falkowbacteria bacterium]|nr:ATP-binding protein [Candidatus Falkowbacteria bacterium]
MEINIKYLAIQNPWWMGGTLKYDPILESYDQQELKFIPPLVNEIVLNKDLIYILRGPRGCGKTVVLKLILGKLIERDGINPKNVLYYSCHNINSYEQLNEIIKVFLTDAKARLNRDRLYIFIDEITLVKHWEKGIEYLRRAGLFTNVELLLSGSMLPEPKVSAEFLNHKVYQEIIMPTLSFSEFLELLNPDLSQSIKLKKTNKDVLGKLDYYLDIYFLTGGFLGAIDSYKRFGAVKQNIYSNFIYWLIADIAKMGRDLVLFRQVLEKVIFNLSKPLGYKTITHKTKAKTHLTAEEYIGILEKMFVLKVQYQAGTGSKINKGKAKKIFFLDPFLFWTFYSYIYGSLSYWQFSRVALHQQEQLFTSLVKNVVFCHLLRKNATKDWTASVNFWRDNTKKREIDFLIKQNNKVMPILVDYGGKARDESKQVFSQAGFTEGIIVSKSTLELAGKIKIMPLSYFLLFF